jgi:hypothetical protein
VIDVTPAFTPTTVPSPLTVAVFVFAECHVAEGSAVMSFFVPSGSVASADSLRESVRPTVHGDGESAIADTDGDDVDEPPHATPMEHATIIRAPIRENVDMLELLLLKGFINALCRCRATARALHGAPPRRPRRAARTPP